MSLSVREQILLSILLIAGLIVGGYYLIFEPMWQNLDVQIALKEKLQTEYETLTAELKSIDQLKKDVSQKELTINERTVKFFPQIIQEELVTTLNSIYAGSMIVNLTENFEKLSEIQWKAIRDDAVTEGNAKDMSEISQDYRLLATGETLEKSVETAAPLTDEQNKNFAKSLKALNGMNYSLTFKAPYENLVNFVSQIELLNRRIIVSQIMLNGEEMTEETLYDATGAPIVLNPEVPYLSGTIDLTFYAIPKLVDQDEDYLNWDLEPNTGKTDPFAAP